MAGANGGSSHSQDPRNALEAYAERANRYSLNLNERVSKDEKFLLCGGAAVVHSGIVDLRKPVLKTADGRLWKDKYGNRVAIKTPKASPQNGESSITKFLKEVHVWSKLNHANVLPLLGITTKFDHTISIVSPWMNNGNAHEYVKEKNVDPRPLIDGIAQGLNYLHGHKPNPIFHGDLKGVNVLISNDGQALLTDFGYSVAVDSSFSIPMSNRSGTKGTMQWMAPEILDGGGVSPEADVWAFGMTTLELFTRRNPFHQFSNHGAVIAKIFRGGPDRPSDHDTCSRMTDKWWDICSKCWEHEPKSRSTMTSITQTTTKLMAMPHGSIPNGVSR